ncbi:hypothetical protein [Curtobacterium sp. GD1]|uniref:hypothetical protein n=1 Tax=Curtobacterium sp. GD1 TaxID=2810612 RepID=UPI001E625D8A|nr:hypothetical protein [Curtobacterium sp. GD1]MCC8907434.1 hypothetical protein [Curtobacterium sp. GD1]
MTTLFSSMKVGAVLAATGITASLLSGAPQPSQGQGIRADQGVQQRNWSPTDVLEGVLFVQGDFGRALLRSGALGPLSHEQRAAVDVAMSDPGARQVARRASAELQARSPQSVKSLMSALDRKDPIAFDAAMTKVGEELLRTRTMSEMSSEVPASTYVPGEDKEGRAVLVVVVAGAVLVVAVVAVGIGVLALASTVAVGSTKVAGQNAFRRASGSNARAQSDALAAAAIRVHAGS